MKLKLVLLYLVLGTIQPMFGQAVPGSYPYPVPFPASGVPPIGSQVITGPATRSAYNDSGPAVWDAWIGGGYRAVSSTTERDAIRASWRKQGMMVFTAADGKLWRLDANLTSWTEILNGVGGSTVLPDNVSVMSDTAAGLTALDTSVWKKAITLGYNSPGDGGGNIFYWVNNKTGVNGGSKIDSVGAGSWTNILADRINVKQWGAVGNGIADDTARIQAAVNAAGDDYTVYFPPGNYLVTSTINVPGRSTTWQGVRTTKGAGLGTDISVGSQFSSSQITFTPASPSSFLVSEFDATFQNEALGPYVFKDMYFQLGTASGFEFGSEGLGVVGIGSNQRYISGVTFSGCGFNQTIQTFYPSGNTVSRLPRKAIHLTKAFETLIDQCSFMGGDTQIRLYGCDNPIVSNCRLQYAWAPYEYIAVDSFGVQGSVTDCQFEAWYGPAINTRDSDLAIMRCRIEQFPSVNHVVTLSQTATVTADSGSITMSSSVANVIIPYCSILKITSGSESIVIYPTGVSGSTVTFNNTTTAIPFSASGCAVKRIHGYGPIAFGAGNVQAIGCSVSMQAGSPSFVMVPMGGAHFSISGAQGTIGQSDVGSLVIANRVNTQFFMNDFMSFSDSSSVVIANPNHPLVTVNNVRNSHGVYGDDANTRSHFGRLDDALSSIVRKYAFRPGSALTYYDFGGVVTFEEVAVASSFSAEKVFAWRYRNGLGNIRLADNTLPSESATSMKVRVKWRTVSAGSGTLTVEAVGNLNASTILTDTGNTNWKISVVTITTPAVWSGSGRTAVSDSVGLNVTCSVDAYIVGVDVLEIDP